MHEYRVIDVSGASPSSIESRLNEHVSSGWMLDKMTHDTEGKARILVMMRVRPHELRAAEIPQ